MRIGKSEFYMIYAIIQLDVAFNIHISNNSVATTIFPREVTWEECRPVEKKVPMSVAQMDCAPLPVIRMMI